MSIDFSNNNFTSNNFNWFTGVIEDINDPLEMGRVRVRCYGFHTENTTSENGIPTSALPWAHVMMPITSPSISGIGESATGVLPGSWVVGFFRDGEACQDPLVLGTLPSRTPSQSSAAPANGFCDPTGTHPKRPNETDIPRGSRSEYTESKSYLKKHNLRQESGVYESATDDSGSGIPMAVPPVTATLLREYPNVDGKPNPFFERKDFIQPDQEEICQPSYPYCHTKEYDAGHTVEYDETPTKERILVQHKSGTFEEIDTDGTKTVVVTGKNYEVIFGDNSVNVKGHCNLSVDGDVRTYIRGDYYMEVEGNHHLNVHGQCHKKVGMGEFVEIGKDRVENIGLSLDTTIGKSEKRTIKGANHNNSPAESYILDIAKGADISIGENLSTLVNGNEKSTVIGTLDQSSGVRTDVINGNYIIDGTSILDIDAVGNITMTTPANVDVDGARIDLN